MKIKEEICLYDGFKIRNYEPSYFDFILDNAHHFNLILSYRIDTKELLLPISSTFLGCSNSAANQKMGFKISLKMVSKNNKMKRCVEISGSFHKFYNNWNHNANDFTFKEFQKVLLEIVTQFKIPPETTELCNLEIGLNLSLPSGFQSRKVCSSIVFVKGKSIAETETRKDRNKNGYSYYTENSTGKKKIYSKSDQFKHIVGDEEIIRIEFKLIKRREIIRVLGINNLKELSEKYLHEKAITFYLKNTQGLIFYQKEIENRSNKINEKQISIYSDQNYWENLWRKSKHIFQLKKRNYYRLLANCGVLNISEFIVCGLRSKLK